MAESKQQGHLFLKRGRIYISFYKPSDGKRTSRFLCEEDEAFYFSKGKPSKALRAKRDEFIREVNEERNAPVAESVKIKTFYETEFLPFVKRELKPSTIHSYEKIWESHLSSHFGERTFAEYETADGSDLLTDLKDRLGRNSLAHVRGVANSLFVHAINLRKLKANPWRDVKVRGKVRPPKPKHFYTDKQVTEFEAKLKDHPRALAIFMLSAWQAMRPGEVSAVRWEDISDSTISIKRTAWRKHLGDTKTEDSAKAIPLFSNVRVALDKWREACGGPSEGFVFQNPKGEPMDMTNAGYKELKRILGPSFVGLYSGRRTAATLLMDTMGMPQAAAQLLRHRSAKTTLDHYIANSGKALEEAVAKVEKKMKRAK